MKIFAALLSLAATPALACDWQIISDKIDPMTHDRVCIIMSGTAKIGLSVRGNDVIFLTGSAYKNGRDGLTVRIDDNEAVRLGEYRSTTAFRDNARTALQQIRSGRRLRTQYLDYPSSKNGDTPICTLPALIDSCGYAPAESEGQAPASGMRWRPQGR